MRLGSAKVERIENHALRVRKGLRLHDIQAEAGNRTGKGGEQGRPVLGDHGQLVGALHLFEMHGHSRRPAALIEPRMRRNLVGRAGAQVSGGKALDELRAFGERGGKFLDAVGLELARQPAVCRVVGPPELIQPPGNHGFR